MLCYGDGNAFARIVIVHSHPGSSWIATSENRTGIFHSINGERREIVIELPDESVVAILREWTPTQSLAAGACLNRKVRDELAASISSLHLDWSPEDINREVARRFLTGEDLGDRYLTLAEAMELDARFRAREAGEAASHPSPTA